MYNNTPTILLGIDTSNYTTSAACSTPMRDRIFGGYFISQEKKPLSVKEGQKGLRQSDAVFAHTVNLPAVIEALFASFDSQPRLLGIGYSSRPRRMDGSYMPCFLSGEAAARSIAASASIPAFAFSHQEGHIAAAAYDAMVHSGTQTLANTPFLAFHVSGGTTDLLHVVPLDDGYDIRLLGTSLDLHAGQAIDRIGIVLGLSFPCGPALEALAECFNGTPTVPKICVRGCDCNLSGVENLARDMWNNGAAKEEVAAFTFRFVCKTLETMTQHALTAYPGYPVLFAGGVMSNHLMRTALSNVCHACGSCAYFAAPAFSADNAAGISLLACRAYRKMILS